MPIPTSEISSHSVQPFLHPIPVQDVHRGSPTQPTFEVEKPRGRRLSRSPSPIPIPPPQSSSSPSSSSSTAPLSSPPPLTWRNAFQDAKAAIYYTKDAFPSSSFLPPPFSREPIAVQPAERVELLDEPDEYSVRVRVLRTGAVGLIPAWNVEGALERLTRINTAFNEAATCPVEARALRRRDSDSLMTSPDGSEEGSRSPPIDQDRTASALVHVHARCVPFATRVRFPDFYGAPSPFGCDSDDDEDEDGEDSSDSDCSSSSEERRSPVERGRLHPPAVYDRPRRKAGASASSGSGSRSRSGGRKSVNFGVAERPLVVFRYPSEELVGAFLEDKYKDKVDPSEDAVNGGSRREGWAAGESQDEDADEEEWWWHGWEEPREECADVDVDVDVDILVHVDANADAVGGIESGLARKASTAPGVDAVWTAFEGDEMFPFFFDEDRS